MHSVVLFFDLGLWTPNPQIFCGPLGWGYGLQTHIFSMAHLVEDTDA